MDIKLPGQTLTDREMPRSAQLVASPSAEHRSSGTVESSSRDRFATEDTMMGLERNEASSSRTQSPNESWSFTSSTQEMHSGSMGQSGSTQSDTEWSRSSQSNTGHAGRHREIDFLPRECGSSGFQLRNSSASFNRLSAPFARRSISLLLLREASVAGHVTFSSINIIIATMSDAALPANQPTVQPIRELQLIPVGLKEAALDSPTFRATTVHFSEQIDLIERWLEGYIKAAQRLVGEVSSLENVVNTLLTQSTPPAAVSEAALDHDYALLAMRRYGEGAREFWTQTLRGMKRYDGAVVEPLKAFLGNEVRGFKEVRRALEAAQKAFDAVLARYLGQSKTKEASSLREDAFQVHEARVRYQKAAFDFCIAAPQIRANLDKLVVKVFAEQWREMRVGREATAASFARTTGEMERVRGWSKEMENSERAFVRELLAARRQVEGSAAAMTKPSRDMDDYAISTVPYTGSAPGVTNGLKAQKDGKNEKQGWLMLRSITGKPARTVWSRRWFYVKSGIFGWLTQGTRSGGVEESEKIGVLLCSVRPAPQEERRFCFEVKTKDSSIVMQAETQGELSEWIAAFEMAKRKALENPLGSESSGTGLDPAFAITPPVAEFAAKTTEHEKEDSQGGLSVPADALPARASVDVGSAARRVTSGEKEPEGSREHAARIIQKLDLHKRSTTATPQLSQGLTGGGGIASLISASHTILPVGPGAPPPSTVTDSLKRNFSTSSSLAPSTLANPPAPTNLSHTAVVLSGDRVVSINKSEGSGTPSGFQANQWGSKNWGYLNRLGDESGNLSLGARKSSQSTVRSQRITSLSQDDSLFQDGMQGGDALAETALESANLGHRKTLSAAATTDLVNNPAAFVPPALDMGDEFPSFYPLPLRAQHAQFQMLFPSVPRMEKVVLVFRATWNPNEQQEFPGRIYVTAREIYIYSNHLGLILITGVSLSSLSEVTAAPGRDCDFLYLHLKDDTQLGDARRITVKVFLEPLRLLQRRLNYLVHNANAAAPESLQQVLKTLIKMEAEPPQRSSSVESWEDVTFDGNDAGARSGLQSSLSWPLDQAERNVKASLRIDGSIYGDGVTAKTGREIQKFRLPAQPVSYAPAGMQASITREFNVSAKALFHVMFGDKSTVFQLLYVNRWGDKIIQTPWTKGTETNSRFTRQFSSQGQVTPLADTQHIDVQNDHLCYVVTNIKRPWRLPYSTRFRPTTKIVITHTAKSRSKLAIFQQIQWKVAPRWLYIRQLIEKQALSAFEADALDLTNVVMDQVAKLGSHSKTNRAIEIFGLIGQQKESPLQLDASVLPGNLPGNVTSNKSKPYRTVGITRLVIDDVLIKSLGLVGWCLDMLMAVSKAILGVCTAHSLLVAFLAVSLLYNSWHGYRDGLVWWQDARATRFMARIGVSHQNKSLRKAIYLRDIDELIGHKPVAALFSADDSTPSAAHHGTCRSTFAHHLTSSLSTAAVTTTAFTAFSPRLPRTLASLASSRHDLLVALRVVNHIERDVVSAAYDTFLQGEVAQCERVADRILARRENATEGPGANLSSAARDGEWGSEVQRYCQDCRGEALRSERSEGQSAL
nr:putative ph domain-containing protein c19a8.02 [Quercus suber]